MSQNIQIINRLRDIIEVLNDVADFESHAGILLGEDQSTPQIIWHYLEGTKEIGLQSKQLFINEQSPFVRALRDKVTVWQELPYLGCYLGDGSQKEPCGGELWIPLIWNEKPVGVLILGAKHGRLFPKYIQWLCEIVVKMGLETLQNPVIETLWEELRFGILHRRAFFPGVPSLDEALNEYLDRCNQLFPKIEVWSTVRLVQMEGVFPISRLYTHLAPDSCRYASMLFRASKNVDIATWDRLYGRSITLSQENVANWLDNIQSEFCSCMPDLDPKYSEHFPDKQSYSHILLPSLYEGHLIAVFTFDNASQNVFNMQIIKALAILTAHAAPVIANAYFRERIVTQRDWFTFLHETSCEFNRGNLSTINIFQIMADSIMRNSGAKAANMLLLRDTDNPVLSLNQGPLLAYSVGLGSDFDKKISPRENGLTFLVLKEKRPMAVNSLDDPPGINPITREKGIQAYACLPMKIRDSIIGVLFVHHERPHFFSESEIEIFSLFANQAASAIERTQLTEKLKGIHQIGREIASSGEVGSILGLVAEQIVKLVNADRSLLILVDGEEGRLIWANYQIMSQGKG